MGSRDSGRGACPKFLHFDNQGLSPVGEEGRVVDLRHVGGNTI